MPSRPPTGPPSPPALDLDLDDGGRLRLRLATPDDAAALSAGFAHLSDDSRYARFFTAMPRLSAGMLERLTDLDGVDRLAIAAFDPDRPSEVDSTDGFGIGVARWIRSRHDEAVAELAVAVVDEYHHRGIGRLMLEALVVAASERGIPRLVAYVLTTNVGMIHLLHLMGGDDVRPQPDEPGVRLVELDVTRTVAERVDPTRRTLLRHIVAPDAP